MKITTHKNGIRFINLDVLSKTGCVHAFGTRDTGGSHSRAHARIRTAFPGIREIATAKQVHGKTHLYIKSAKEAVAKRHTHADMVIVNSGGLAAAVRTADCVPVLIFDPETGAAAAVHAGWKGTSLRAPGEAVKILTQKFGSRPADLSAGIGPCILPCHYQVDKPVIEVIKESFGKKADRILIPDGPGHARLDLSLANRIALEEAGLLPGRIQEVRKCTYCHPELFFSYRREGKGVPSLYHFIAGGRVRP